MSDVSRFRPDIQGLRAVAVLLVALDHANVGPLTSGFVGVDVFFVVSGFLITQLLLAEASRSGRISLATFYARRARRILPAATLVLAATVVAAVLLLSRVDAATVATDAVWATLFFANVKFGRDGTDYFAADVPPSPLQHYWSLSIEEQYYLVWPAVLAVLVVLAVGWRRRSGRDVLPALVTLLLGVVIAASLAWSVGLTADDPTAAYFSTAARVWELALGGLAAVGVPLARRSPAALRALASWAGLAAVGWASVATEVSDFPGWVVAAPVAGTALLLLGGVAPTRLGPQGLLSLPPLRLVGDWSYSFYLWHWPVLVLAARVWREPEGWTGLGLLVLSLGLSGLTYRYVENAFRGDSRRRASRSAGSTSPVHGLLLYPVAVATSLAVALAGGLYVRSVDSGRTGEAIAVPQAADGTRQVGSRFSDDDAVALVRASALAAHGAKPLPVVLRPDPFGLAEDLPSVGECDYKHWPNRQLCPRGDADGDRTLVVLGDSHGRAWIPALERIATQRGWRTYYLVKQGCTAAALTPWDEADGEVAEGCLAFREWALARIAALSPDLVLLASDAPRELLLGDGSTTEDDDVIAGEMTRGLRATVARVSPLAGRLVMLGDVPGQDEAPALCLSGRDVTLATCASEATGRGLLMKRAARDAAAATRTDFVDPTRWFCALGTCPIVVGDVVTFRDREHITAVYAEKLAGPLAEAIGLRRPRPAGPSARG